MRKNQSSDGRDSQKETPVYARNQSVAAFILDMPLRTFQRWCRRGMPGRRPDTGYDLVEARSFLNGQPDGQGENSDGSLAHWRRRFERARARRAERADAREAKEVVTRDEHHRVLNQVCSAFTSALRMAPNELAPKVVNKPLREVQRIIEEWANGVIDAFFGPPE